MTSCRKGWGGGEGYGTTSDAICRGRKRALTSTVRTVCSNLKHPVPSVHLQVVVITTVGCKPHLLRFKLELQIQKMCHKPSGAS